MFDVCYATSTMYFIAPFDISSTLLHTMHVHQYLNEDQHFYSYYICSHFFFIIMLQFDKFNQTFDQVHIEIKKYPNKVVENFLRTIYILSENSLHCSSHKL